jgi:hypothetical protein
VPPINVAVPPVEPAIVKRSKTMMELNDEKERREREEAEQLE